jgi:hypothetical protein
VAEPTGEFRFRMEMGITRKEFLRSLSAALGGQTCLIEHNELVFLDEGRQITITLCEQHEQRIGSLRLPRMMVEFSFSGYSDSEAKLLMADFDTHFHRGGG